jgi:uncharacterized protein YndB with AHSA1/START domain
MPASATNTAHSGFTVDHATHTLRFERDLKASPAQVFRAWTAPEHLAQWWDAAGERLMTCEVDLRVGGAFKFVTAGHPDMPFAGTYSEITPPHRLVFQAMGAEGRVVIEVHGKGARLTVEIACGSAAMLEQYAKAGVAVGTSQTLDNLVGYLDGEAVG